MLVSTRVLDGAPLAAAIKREVASEVADLRQRHDIVPCLAAIRVGDDAASAVYVRNKIRACEEVGIRSEHHSLPATTTSPELLDLIGSLNCRDDIDGILVQLPLPAHIEEGPVVEAVDPAKDVDGFHPINVGKLAMGRPGFVPCTPAGVIEILDRCNIQIRAANACVIGRSQIVGRPVAQLLLQRDATVNFAARKTDDRYPLLGRQADILIREAIGRVGLKLGVITLARVVIDAGMNKVQLIRRSARSLAASRTIALRF